MPLYASQAFPQVVLQNKANFGTPVVLYRCDSLRRRGFLYLKRRHLTLQEGGLLAHSEPLGAVGVHAKSGTIAEKDGPHSEPPSVRCWRRAASVPASSERPWHRPVAATLGSL